MGLQRGFKGANGNKCLVPGQSKASLTQRRFLYLGRIGPSKKLPHTKLQSSAKKCRDGFPSPRGGFLAQKAKHPLSELP